MSLWVLADWIIKVLPYIFALSVGSGLILFSIAWFFIVREWKNEHTAD